MGAPAWSEVIDGYEALCGRGATASAERDVVTVTGPDSGRYLQGQLSQEVVTLPVGSSTWSLLLQPTGKVDAWLRVHRVGDETFALDVDADWGETLVARLTRFLLRTKATVGAPERRLMLARRHGAGFVELGRLPEGPAAAPGVLTGIVVGPGVAGIDHVLARGVVASDLAAAGESSLVPVEAFERYRIAHAVPALGAELTTDTIPAEGGQWLIDASVSFTKGCYTGQELVARIDSRGNTVPRPVRLLEFADGAFVPGSGPAQGAGVAHDGKDVGRCTSVAPALGEGHPALALATVARSVPLGAGVEVDAGSGGRVDAVVLDPPTPR
jgi:folate-binding protein YgfZ